MTTISNNQFMVLDSWENACDDDVLLNVGSNVEDEITKTPPKTPPKRESNRDKNEEDLEVASLTDFPSLAMSKQANSGKNKKGYTIMHIPQKSYKEVKQEEIKSKRTEAFEKLANKDSLSDRLYKTSICRSVLNKEECLHGSKCRFAHSLEELRTSCCLFGKDCRFVKCINDSWTNMGNKMCTHMHPDESRQDFLTRIGVDISNIPKDETKVVPKVVPKVEAKDDAKIEPKDDAKIELKIESKIEPNIESNIEPNIEPKVTSPRTPSKKFPHPIEKVANAIKSKTYGEGDAEIKETVIRVPAALSQQALEMALKSGMQCFRVEVI